MSKIKSAEEYFKQRMIELAPTERMKKFKSVVSYTDEAKICEEYADYVLKAKLESITDEVKKIQENLILIIEGFEDAKENYGYDLANETYYTEQIIQSTKAIKYRLKLLKDE